MFLNGYSRYIKLHYVGFGSVVGDEDIAKITGLDLQEYIEILKEYGGIQFLSNYYFVQLEDCLRCVDYLNKTYEVIIKLMEK